MGSLKEAGDPGNLGERGRSVILKGMGFPGTLEGRERFVILGEEFGDGLWRPYVFWRSRGEEGSCDLRKGGLDTLRSGGRILVTVEGIRGPVTPVEG